MEERLGSAVSLLQESKKISRLVDDYDRSVRVLQFERRGQPLDRMKTEEELAKEEKERLEALEVRYSVETENFDKKKCVIGR